VFSTLEVFYENALYKFTFDIDIEITARHDVLVRVTTFLSLSQELPGISHY